MAGSIMQGNAAAGAANYNAQIARQNAQIDRQKAIWAGQAGEQQAHAQELKTRATVGAIKAAQAAGNIDVNTGSAVDVRSSAAALGELDAINIRSNATRVAYGYNVEAVGQENQANLDRFAASNDITAGYLGGATTLLGGIGGAAAKWINYRLLGLLTPPVDIAGASTMGAAGNNP
jgi:hypothetical protein